MASKKEILDGLLKYAEKKGYILNPDEKVVDAVVNGLIRNEERLGARYCPCRIPSGDKAKDVKIICPCAFHKKEIESMGHCHCMLFFRRDGPEK